VRCALQSCALRLAVRGPQTCAARVSQTAGDPVQRWKWVDYSSFDAKATWDLYHSLRARLEVTECEVDAMLRAGVCGGAGTYSQWDLYRDVFRPFGELLTSMEQARGPLCHPHPGAERGCIMPPLSPFSSPQFKHVATPVCACACSAAPRPSCCRLCKCSLRCSCLAAPYCVNQFSDP
jgi:hypothetical protein